MARPPKIGLDYFPVDVVFDSKIQAIELLYGNDGLVWVWKVWQQAYQTDNGEVNLDGLFGELHAKNCRITQELHYKIMQSTIDIKLFYKTDNGFITSNGIKKRLSAVSSERKKAIKRKEKRLKEIKVKESKTSPDCSPNNSQLKRQNKTMSYTDDFELFWKEFPKRKDKGHAFIEWKRQIITTEPIVIIDGAKRYKKECYDKKTEEKYIKMAQGWLSGQRWTDETSSESVKQKSFFPSNCWRPPANAKI